MTAAKKTPIGPVLLVSLLSTAVIGVALGAALTVLFFGSATSTVGQHSADAPPSADAAAAPGGDVIGFPGPDADPASAGSGRKSEERAPSQDMSTDTSLSAASSGGGDDADADDGGEVKGAVASRAPAAIPSRARYQLDFGVFSDEAAAATLQAGLAQHGIDAVVLPRADDNGTSWFQVRAGGFVYRQQASLAAVEVRRRLGLTPNVVGIVTQPIVNTPGPAATERADAAF